MSTIVLTLEQAAFVRALLDAAAEQAHVVGWAPALNAEDTPENEAKLEAAAADLEAVLAAL